MSDTLLEPCFSELLIRKSRFLGRVEPARDRPHALSLLASIRRDHPAATHVCWALMAGGQSAAVDDGEPSGTAGRPMLEVLRHQQLEGVLASVVRYYGGVNLGAGGLVRAYSDAVAQALKNAQRRALVPVATVVCRCPFGFEGLVRHRIDEAQLEVRAIERTLDLKIVLEGPAEALDRLMEALREKGQGRIVFAAAEDRP